MFFLECNRSFFGGFNFSIKIIVDSDKNTKGNSPLSVDESGELVDFTKYGFCEQGCNLKIGKNDFITSIIGL